MARRKPREQTVRLLFEPPQRLRRIRLPVSRREGRAHAGVRPALVANGRGFIAQYRAPAVHFSASGATEEFEEYRVELEDVAAFEFNDHPEPEWRLIRLTGTIALGMTKDAVHFPFPGNLSIWFSEPSSYFLLCPSSRRQMWIFRTMMCPSTRRS
jgi:hypothetical protein